MRSRGLYTRLDDVIFWSKRRSRTLDENVLVSYCWNCGIFELESVEARLAGHDPGFVAHVAVISGDDMRKLGRGLSVEEKSQI